MRAGPKRSEPLNQESRQALLIFTRNPELGKCKTRLAATVGDHAALEIYLHLLRHTATVCFRLEEADKYVYFSEFAGESELWDPAHFTPEIQEGSDLGARMRHAFETAFARGYRRVVVIGSDLPDLQTADLQQAFVDLQTHEVVLGPASDGGYYLLGLTELVPGLFENKSWGGKRVLEETLSDLEGFRISLLTEKNDVDRYEDIAERPEFQPYLRSDKDDPETTG